MKCLGIAAMIAAVTLVSCTDDQAPLDVAVSQPETVEQPAASFSVTTSGSTICQSYVAELAAARADLEQAPGSAELQEARNALEAMASDACN